MNKETKRLLKMAERSAAIHEILNVLSNDVLWDKTTLHLSEDSTILIVEFTDYEEPGTVTEWLTVPGTKVTKRKAMRKLYMAYSNAGITGVLAVLELNTRQLAIETYMGLMDHRLEVIK